MEFSDNLRVVDRLRANSLAVDVALASGVALVLGLLRLGAPSLWVDEAFTAKALWMPPAELVDRQYHVLYYMLLKPWTAVAGTSGAALRLPSVFGAMLACGLLVILARRVCSRPVALASGLFLAVSPFVVKWSQQARGYTLLLALSVAAMLLLLRAVERGSRGAWLLYGVAFSAMVVWHPVAGVLLAPAQALLIVQRRERAMPHVLLAAVVILAVGVPWAAVTAIRSTGEGVAMDWLTFPTYEVAAHGLLDVSGAAGVGVALALLGLWMLWRASCSDVALWLGTWAFAPFVVALVISIFRPIYLDRYLLVAAPAFAMLAAAGVARVGTRARVLLLTAVVIASAAGLAQWYSFADGGNWRGEDWRSAVVTVLDRRSEADAIVVAPWSSAPASEYYGADVVDVSTEDSIWVLTWSESGDDITASERAALGFGEHRLVERLPFGRRVSAQLWKR